MLNLKEVVEHLVRHKIISKDVANISLNVNQASLYENILTNDNLEPTQFLEELVRLSGYRLIQDPADDTFKLEPL